MKLKLKLKLIPIYDDPLTRTQLEGKAQILKCLWEADELVRCVVRFPEDPYDEFERWVNKADLAEEGVA